jgi:hypothetical protein
MERRRAVAHRLDGHPIAVTTPRIHVESLAPVDPADLVGTWHIVETNFPMWLSGKKTAPTLNYGASDRPSRLADVVRYTQGGRAREIRGVDTQDAANRAHFTWRGSGLLALLKSDWYVVRLDRDLGAMAIYFTPTLFTPRGMDIAFRSPRPEATAVESMKAAARAIPGLEAQVASLARLGG